MIRRPPRSTLFPYTTALPISLPREAKCFPLIQIKGNSVDRVHRTGFGGIFDDQVFDLEEQSLSPPQPRIQDFVEGEPEQIESEHKEDETQAGNDKPPDVAPDHEGAAADRLVDHLTPAHRIVDREPQEGEDGLRQD